MAAAAALPAGRITFLFTDIEGSTRLVRALGDAAYDAVLTAHQGVLRAVWAAHGGQVVSTPGDGFLVVFGRAADALRAGVAAQRAMGAASWPTALPVRVRIGLHTGFGTPAGGDYAALAVHQAARVVDAAHGGQVLATEEAVAAAALDTGDAAVRTTGLGRFRVRDFDAPVALFAVHAPAQAPAGPAPRVRPADGHNLVRAQTTLVGRAGELAALGERWGAGAVTTVVGPGGVGKTRLVVETALARAAEWPDGAWFVDLVPVASPDLVPDAVGDAVGAPSAPGVERWELVCDHLAEREALVVLDNCEHLLPAVASVAATLVARCPGVGVVATSRTALGLRGERVFALRPLPSGASGDPAVDLFLDRAADAAGLDRARVAELCAELDGLPLAIELAAARTTAVGPEEILRRLRSSPSVLRSRDPTLPDRHRTLERLLGWSHDLLGPDARLVLGRMTVFASDFDLEGAQAVGGDDRLEGGAVAELLWALVDASLVTVEAAAGATRYRLLSTVRAFAAQHTPAEERDAAALRLARRSLERVGPGRASGRAWIGEMTTERDNIRGAAAAVAAAHPALAQALVWSIGRHHDVTDAFRTGIAELTRWVALLPARTPERVALLTVLADLHTRVAELDTAERLVAEAAALAEEVEVAAWNSAGLARTQGDLDLRRGRPAAAAERARRALAGATHPWARSRLSNLLGIALCELGDPRSAVDAFAEELAAGAAAGVETFAATAHANLAEAHLRLGEHGAAARHQERALELAREQRQPVVVGFSVMVAARLLAGRGEPRRAAVLQAAADDLLAQASYALYDEDRRLRDELVADARAALGAPAHDEAVAEGRALGAEAAADLASGVLVAVRSGPPTQEAVP